ncbi:MAG: hypothetical protein SH808_05535 [Saprospiraceae bacterium]|nr:hypothetical protein [Saprospiraceae bacterium]
MCKALVPDAGVLFLIDRCKMLSIKARNTTFCGQPQKAMLVKSKPSDLILWKTFFRSIMGDMIVSLTWQQRRNTNGEGQKCY